MCERCGAELAVVEGLCCPCAADALELDVRVVESERPRYGGTGARLETKLRQQEEES